MKPVSQIGLGLALLCSAYVAQAKPAGPIVLTNTITGTQVMVEVNGKNSHITELASGDAIDVKGTWPADLTDQSYTEMMASKFDGSSMTIIDGVPYVSISVTPYAELCSSTYQSDFIYTYACTLDSNSVTADFDATLSAGGGYQDLQVTLYRFVSFWQDQPEGTYSFPVNEFSTNSYSQSWNAVGAGRYYLQFTKNYDGYTIGGEWALH